MENFKPEHFDEELETEALNNIGDSKLESNPEKIERERSELLRRLVANNIVSLKEARNSDIDLAWIYWQTYQADRFKQIVK